MTWFLYYFKVLLKYYTLAENRLSYLSSFNPELNFKFGDFRQNLTCFFRFSGQWLSEYRHMICLRKALLIIYNILIYTYMFFSRFDSDFLVFVKMRSKFGRFFEVFCLFLAPEEISNSKSNWFLLILGRYFRFCKENWELICAILR